MNRLLQRLDAWPFWQARTSRERRLLAILAGLALVALLLVAVVRPLQAARGEAQADIRTYQDLAARLRAVAQPGGPAVPLRTGDAAAVAAAVALETGLTPQRTTPAGAAAEVGFADAPYEAVLRWIAAVERTSRFRVRRLTIVPGASAGLVRAEATVG